METFETFATLTSLWICIANNFQVFRKVGGALEDRVIKWFDYLWQNKVCTLLDYLRLSQTILDYRRLS